METLFQLEIWVICYRNRSVEVWGCHQTESRTGVGEEFAPEQTTIKHLTNTKATQPNLTTHQMRFNHNVCRIQHFLMDGVNASPDIRYHYPDQISIQTELWTLLVNASQVQKVQSCLAGIEWIGKAHANVINVLTSNKLKCTNLWILQFLIEDDDRLYNFLASLSFLLVLFIYNNI